MSPCRVRRLRVAEFFTGALFADADDYAEVLRRGLEQSRREKGDDHEKTLAHLAALANEESRMWNEESRMC